MSGYTVRLARALRAPVLPLVVASSALCAGTAHAQAERSGWQFGAVLDASASSSELALGHRDKGLALGHSDLSASGPLGRHLHGRVTAAAHTEERKLEVELEEAWTETRTLPAGLQLRAGRFASQIGYLNEQHPHADDFVQRPLMHRAFLGRHWVDDGLRLNWTAPTDLYLRLGAEVLRGRGLVREAENAPTIGAGVLSARIGGDLGASHGWQAGLSWMHNRRQAEAGHDDEAGAVDDDHGVDSGHSHGASFSGRRMWLGDVTWKWAPGGNNAREQVRVAYERALVKGLGANVAAGERHVGDYLSAVWRFAPAWEAGLRTSLLKVRIAHDDHLDDGRMRENALMLAYKPTHAQVVRLQYTHQRDRGGFDNAARALQLQYILSFGAHAAHSF